MYKSINKYKKVMTFVINYRTYISENNKVGAKPLKFRLSTK